MNKQSVLTRLLWRELREGYLPILIGIQCETLFCWWQPDDEVGYIYKSGARRIVKSNAEDTAE